MLTVEDYAASVPITWCPGCGNFAILQALKKALVAIGLEPHQILFVSGIGQGPKLPHFTRGNVFNGLHGRSIPAATGARLANHDLTVIGIDGDGGAYGEGQRIKLAYTRSMVNAALSGELDQVEYIQDPTFGLQVPTSCPQVPDQVLQPRLTWEDGAAYDRQAEQLADMFVSNFAQFAEDVAPEIKAAGPVGS